MKYKFHWPTLITHLMVYNTIFFLIFLIFLFLKFFKKTLKKKILINPRIKCINEMQKNKILSKNFVQRNERDSTRTMSDRHSEVKSFLHPHFLRCRPKVGVFKHMGFLINSSIGIKAKSLYQLMNKYHEILCFWHKHFLFDCLLSCLQLETIWVYMPSSTIEVTKPLRLVIFLTYRMSRFWVLFH